MPKKWRAEGCRGLLWLDNPPLVFWLCYRFLHLLAACIGFGKWSSCGWNSAMFSPQLLSRIVTLFSPPCLLLLTIWPHFGSPVLWWEGSWTAHCPEWRRVTQKALADNHLQTKNPSGVFGVLHQAAVFKRGVVVLFCFFSPWDILFFTNLCSLPLWSFQ